MTTSGEPILNEPRDFSLALGGPLYQLWRRGRLTGDALEMMHRRVIVLSLLAWLPLLLLSVAQGTAWGGRVAVPFLQDVEMHVRLLVALPLLIVAELVVNQRTRLTVRQFVERGLIPDAARRGSTRSSTRRCACAIRSSRRCRSSRSSTSSA